MKTAKKGIEEIEFILDYSDITYTTSQLISLLPAD